MVPVNPELGDRHRAAFEARMTEITEEEDSAGAIIDIRPITDNQGTAMWATIVDMETGEATTRNIETLIIDLNAIRIRLARRVSV